MINKLFSKKIGADEFGNQYFINNKNKRFVKYKGLAEPSKIPAEWHGWIHYNQDNPPVINTQNKKFSWQKIHLPNLTGTKLAYLPKPHSSNKINNVYESWQP